MLGMSLARQHMSNINHLESGVIMREPDGLLSEMLRKRSVAFYKLSMKCYVFECSESEGDRTDVKALVKWTGVNNTSSW